jgi:hypothetical protein
MPEQVQVVPARLGSPLLPPSFDSFHSRTDPWFAENRRQVSGFESGYFGAEESPIECVLSQLNSKNESPW